MSRYRNDTIIVMIAWKNRVGRDMFDGMYQ